MLDRELRGDFFEVSKEEIKNMHPLIALRTLQKFGFRQYRKMDTVANRELNKIERVDHWLKNYVAEHYAKNDVRNAISGNKNLLIYLDLIAQYVNSSSCVSILNPEYSGKTEQDEFAKEIEPTPPPGFAQPVEPLEPSAKPPVTPEEEFPMAKLSAYLETQRWALIRDFNQINKWAVSNRCPPFMVGVINDEYFCAGYTRSYQSSVPQVVKPIDIEWLRNKIKEAGSSRLIREVFSMYINRLRDDYNVVIKQDDLDNMKKLVEELEKVEMDSINYMEALREYMVYKDAYGDQCLLEEGEGEKKNIFSVENLKEFVIKCREKMEKKFELEKAAAAVGGRLEQTIYELKMKKINRN